MLDALCRCFLPCVALSISVEYLRSLEGLSAETVDNLYRLLTLRPGPEYKYSILYTLSMASNSLFNRGRTVPDSNFDDDEEVEWVDLREEGEAVEGTILEIQDDAGEYGSRVYKLDSPEHDCPVLFWGKTDLDQKVRRAGLDLGDELGVRNSGETRETENGTQYVYEVVFARQE